MIANRNFRVKSAACVVALAIFTSAAAQTPPKEAPESREGLPASYTGPASAVAAIVDDKVITTYDVEQRLKFMLLTGGAQQVTQQMLQQLQARALRDLVEEDLKLLEADKYDVKVETKEIDDELRNMGAQNGLSLEDLEEALKAQGISISSMRQQIKSNIAWSNLVQGRFHSRVRVDDAEVDDTLKRMRDEASKEQFLVSEICIPVPDPSQAQAYYQGSLQLIEQMRKGVPFAAVAQQFSACPSAAAGGDIGWVHAGELPKEIDQALRVLPQGAVTNPIPSEGAFMIMALRDKRPAVVPGEQSWTLAYVSAPASIGHNAALTDLQKVKSADVCATSALRLDLGPNVSIAHLENMKLGDIDERFRDAVKDLDRGDLSGMIEADGAYHMVYVCDKDDGLGLPSRQAIEDRIYGRQMGKISQQYLRDVERKTMVDIRMKTGATPNG